MAFYGQHRMAQMQQEMERFEQEIAGQLARPPTPRMAGPNMSLRFIPHQLHAARPAPYAPHPNAPPVSFSHGSNISTAAVAAAALASSAGPRFQPPPVTGTQRPQGAVIEGAPTKYTTPANGKEIEFKKLPTKPPPPAPEPIAAPPPAVSTKSASAETSQSKSSESKASSSSTLAYTIIGGTYKPPPSQEPRKHKRYVRVAGGQSWTDPSLNDWDPNDFRIFCGDLGNEVSDELLAKAFRQYPSFQKAKVVRDNKTNKTKGYGFVSFKDPDDFTRAMREMDGKYVGNRPIKLRKSTWKDRNVEVVRKKKKAKQKLGLKL